MIVGIVLGIVGAAVGFSIGKEVGSSRALSFIETKFENVVVASPAFCKVLLSSDLEQRINIIESLRLRNQEAGLDSV